MLPHDTRYKLKTGLQTPSRLQQKNSTARISEGKVHTQGRLLNGTH